MAKRTAERQITDRDPSSDDDRDADEEDVSCIHFGYFLADELIDSLDREISP